MKITPFHIAIPVRDLPESRWFYSTILGCEEGRSSQNWIDFNLYGHQLVCHLNPHIGRHNTLVSHYNPVDGQSVPVPHYGVVLEMDQWETLAAELSHHAVEFIIAPTIRFKGDTGEQATMFFLDPTGNALEFKALKDMTELFAS